MFGLKRVHLDLHADRRKCLTYSLSFAMLSFLLLIIVFTSVDADLSHIATLNRSQYVYSAAVKDPIGPDNYYHINAGITFVMSKDSQSSINAEVIMQTEDANYTDSVYWNANRLETNEIAISQHYAKANNLGIDDVIYSKHVVDGLFHEYRIKQVIPEISCARVENNSYSTVLIIMGYDKAYIDNISYTALVFTKIPVDNLITEYCVAPEHLVYKDDEIAILNAKVLPYLMALAILIIFPSLLLALFLSNGIKHNFSRLIIIGFSKEELGKAYSYYLFVYSCVFILLNILLSLTFHFIYQFCFNIIMILMPIILLEALTIFVVALYFYRHMWRA